MQNQPVTEPVRGRLKFATQVHAEAVSIVALRGLAHSIGDADTGAQVRAKIAHLIADKAQRMGLNGGDFEPAMDRNFAAIEAVDAALTRILHAPEAAP